MIFNAQAPSQHSGQLSPPFLLMVALQPTGSEETKDGPVFFGYSWFILYHVQLIPKHLDPQGASQQAIWLQGGAVSPPALSELGGLFSGRSDPNLEDSS